MKDKFKKKNIYLDLVFSLECLFWNPTKDMTYETPEKIQLSIKTELPDRWF